MREVQLLKKVNKYNDKEYVSYKVGKMNETGNGLLVEEKLTGKVMFDPKIRKGIKFKDKTTGEQKTFDAVSVVLELDNKDMFPSIELNDYGNVTFDLPSGCIKYIEKDNITTGDRISIYLRPFEVTDKEGKVLKRSTWKLDRELNEKVTHHNIPEAKSTIIDAEVIQKIKAAVDAGDKLEGIPNFYIGATFNPYAGPFEMQV